MEKESYEILKEGNDNVMRLDYEKINSAPNLEESFTCMADVVTKLSQEPGISRIIFRQRRNYHYGENQVKMLNQVASLYNHLVKTKKFFLNLDGLPYLNEKRGIMQDLVSNLKGDPIGAYVQLRRLLREERLIKDRLLDQRDIDASNYYISVMKTFIELLEKTKLINSVKPFLEGYKIGDRSIYRKLFHADVTPDFMFTRMMSKIPVDGHELDSYMIDKMSDVSIFEKPDDVKYLYYLNPPEFKISEDKYELLDLAKRVLINHKPRAEEFVDPEKMRSTFYNIGKDMLQELADRQGVELTFEELNELTHILVRYTVGFGLLEVLLKDEKVQDITINSPIGQTPIFIVHQDYDECVTNIIPSSEDAESWATKFRLLSGRALDEANPVLDTELAVPGARARVAIISKPLSPYGLAYALRRHRDKPWTLSLFAKNRMINPMAAGLMSFLIDGSRTMLVAGTRSSGKCVEGNTLIQLSDGNITSIKDLIKGKKSVVDDGFIYEEEKPPNIVSLSHYKLKNKRLSTYWKKRIKKRLIRIRTKSGREIVTTEEHPYFTFDKGIKSVFASQISKGQFIATPRRVNIQGKNGIKQFIDFKTSDGFIEMKSYYQIEGITNSRPVKFPKYMDEKFAEFLGYLLGDGYIDECKIEFNNTNKLIKNRYKEIIHIFGISFREFNGPTGCCVIQITSRLLSRALSETFEIPLGKKSGEIKIPKEILKSDKKVLSAFLRAYFDCDGYISRNRRDLEISTKSKLMSKQLQMVFLRYGIVLFCKKKIIDGEYYYRILIRGNFVNIYYKTIGSNHPMKKNRLKEISERDWINNTNVDVIPQGDYYLKELRKRLRIFPKQIRLGTGKDYWAYEHKNYRITRNCFKNLTEFYSERFNELKNLFWKVEEITKLINLRTNYDDSISMFDNLRKLLDVSYVEMASYFDFSDSWLRKLIQKKSYIHLTGLNGFERAYFGLEKKSLNFKNMLNLEADICNLKQFIDNTPLTYVQMSKDTKISESMLKYYSYGDFKISLGKKEIINHYLDQFKKSLAENIKQSDRLFKKLETNFKTNLINFNKIGILFGELRNELNIENKDLITENLSIGTISNFFNFVHDNPKLETVFELSKKLINIYNDAVSDKTKEILDIAINLSNSDLFWDEINEVKEVNSNEKYVYDLTVPETHNFVANGIIAHNTSFLGSMLVEIMRKYRIITAEDTLELPVDALRNLGYNIQPMKVRSAITGGETEMEAAEGIRTSLRLGDSALVVGEIRSVEAKALYEAMRVGALANVVAGTIHGDSPYGVYDRVVNDLEVPKTSFKATDIVVVCNPVKSSDGLHKWRRVVQITEVRKNWEDDPLREGGFVDLMRYDTKEDGLKPSDELMNGDSEILKGIASNVGEWVGNWDAVWDNIILRAKIKEALINYSEKTKNENILEARFNILANDQFHKISDSVKQEVGSLDPRRIFFEWEEWLKRMIKMRKI